jgi:hypothetical protein
MASREAGNTREILIVKHTELPDESGNPGNPGNPGHGRPVARAHSGISVARPGDTVRWTNRTEDDATLSFPRCPFGEDGCTIVVEANGEATRTVEGGPKRGAYPYRGRLVDHTPPLRTRGTSNPIVVIRQGRTDPSASPRRLPQHGESSGSPVRADGRLTSRRAPGSA